MTSCWMIGISLAPEARGDGYGTEATRQLARYLFLHTQMNRAEAQTGITSLAAQRALERTGFTREGVRRGASFRRTEAHIWLPPALHASGEVRAGYRRRQAERYLEAED